MAVIDEKPNGNVEILGVEVHALFAAFAQGALGLALLGSGLQEGLSFSGLAKDAIGGMFTLGGAKRASRWARS